MFNTLFNWRSLLAIIAIAIVTGTVFYSNHLAKEIAADEKIKIEQWVEATKDIANPNSTESNLVSMVFTENSKAIPMVLVTENDSIIDYRNLDSVKIAEDKTYLKKKLKEFKKLNAPIVWKNPYDSLQTNRVFYGESVLLKQVRYYPIIQLFIVALFIIITLIAISTRNKSTQNQVWAGMAKETAHQLGTPLTSLQGWVEMLKETPSMEKIVPEMSKDVDRLKLVSDRFGKIGSTPQLELNNIVTLVQNMVAYIKRRSPEKVNFNIETHGETEIKAMVNGPLFDWVIENLMKNGLDAMEGKGTMTIDIKNENTQVQIDVTDTGKGISTKNIPRVFKPGFTTKKRGWGLGLTLCKRIIEQYHKGELFVKHSEPGKGTTFRIVLKK
ncbi:MAG: HAMP domain-containing histidine kinase [Ferruginibacter sp.]|nr:HAMP domain-containing histidine kinase [Ferruginibacter sp.]